MEPVCSQYGVHGCMLCGVLVFGHSDISSWNSSLRENLSPHSINHELLRNVAVQCPTEEGDEVKCLGVHCEFELPVL